MKRIILLYMAIVIGLTVFAVDNKTSNFDFAHNRVSFSGSVTSSDSYQLEASYHYMFNRYIGVGGALGFWKVWYEEGWASGKDWEIESDDNAPFNFYLHPSLILKSPSLKIKNVDLGLYAEPGVMMNVPYAGVNIRQYTKWPDYELDHISTCKGQWFALDLRVGVYVNIGPCGFSAGYLMSNFDVYSQYRHLSYKGIKFSRFYPNKSFMHGGFLTASYYF